jgi:predicted nucleic acid-binding protein
VKFWDASAVVTLCINEPASERVRAILRSDPQMATWWGTPVECWSAIARRRREGWFDTRDEDAAREVLRSLGESWLEVQPAEEVRAQAGRILRIHAVRAADALQLAAALTWAGSPRAGEIVALDQRIREAARLEGLTPLPE